MQPDRIEEEEERRKQPRHWMSKLIDKYRDPKLDFLQQEPRVHKKQYEPLEVKPQPNPFDPSAYYNDIRAITDFSKQFTQQEQEAANLRRRQQQQQQSLIESPHAQRFQSGEVQGLSQPLQNYSFTSGYGPRRSPTSGRDAFHAGIDLAAPSGTPIYATHDGYITSAGWNGGYGLMVSVSGSGGMETRYAHQSKLAVQHGQRVRQGELIGYIGSTGDSTGPHLHYEVRINGQHVDPRGYI